jgi:acetyl esterase/lipase
VSQTPPSIVPPTAPTFDPPVALPPEVELREGIVFARPGGEPLECELFLPRTRSHAPRPGIVWVHGGGWTGKARGGKVLWRQAAHLASLGYPGVNITYRLAPAHTFPAQLEDVWTGLRWLHSHAAELGVDPERIGAVGESAGGHLAMLLGTSASASSGAPPRVQAVVAYYGVFDLPGLWTEPGKAARNALLGGDLDRAAEGSLLWDRARTGSPLHTADAQTPPVLLLHGTADAIVPFDQSVRFQKRLRELGVWADLVPGVDGAHGHIRRPPFYGPALEQTTAFLAEVLA